MIEDTFIDGKTRLAGKWAYMCKECFIEFGVGLGIGQGQLYHKQGDKFLRLA